MTPRLSTAARAYAAGLRAKLMPQTPYRAWQTQEALRQAIPEIAAAWAAGMSADPAAPLPCEGALLAVVVRGLAAAE